MTTTQKKTPTLQQLSASIARWQARQFPDADVGAAVEHLRREAIELVQHYFEINRGDGEETPWLDLRATPTGTSDERGEEMADIFFMLVQAANKEGRDLAADVAAKYAKNLLRKWKAPDAHGVVEHEEG